jgi:hypothetical protein
MRCDGNAYEIMNKRVSDNRHSMIGKIDKEIKHGNMIKWQRKMTKYT